MPLSTSLTAFVLPFSCLSHPIPKGFTDRSFSFKKDFKICSEGIKLHKSSRNGNFAINSAAGDQSSSVGYDVQFPNDYSELLRQQAKVATELAMKDNRKLMVSCLAILFLHNDIAMKEQHHFIARIGRNMSNKFLKQEIEFPTAGLESVPGDGEGGIEMTESMCLIREFCDLFITAEKVTRTRIFFPEANEVQFARNSVFGGVSYKLDYLTKPSFFEDFGFVQKVKMADRVKPEDEVFLVAYPYFNVNEMLVVEELYKEAVVSTPRKLIIFNGELDRIRSGYYPSFFYPKLAALTTTFFPKMETVYYIHNFKGQKGGVLFRSYPGPWKVLRKTRKGYICLHQQELMPSLKEVALNILPSI